MREMITISFPEVEFRIKFSCKGKKIGKLEQFVLCDWTSTFCSALLQQMNISVPPNLNLAKSKFARNRRNFRFLSAGMGNVASRSLFEIFWYGKPVTDYLRLNLHFLSNIRYVNLAA